MIALRKQGNFSRGVRLLLMASALVLTVCAHAQPSAEGSLDRPIRQLLDIAIHGPPTTVPSGVTDDVFWDGFDMCGNGVIDANEQCDRSDLGSSTCGNFGYSGGTLACDHSCHYDTSRCTGQCPSTCQIDADCGACGVCVQSICI